MTAGRTDFDTWLDEQLSIEVAERGGFTDREAEEFTEQRKEDPYFVSNMRTIYDRREKPE